jgi:hypothetical protein
MRCFVYFNLHRHCFSVKSLSTGRVIAHADTITLKNASFKVSEAGRQRVLREKRKNVHAGVVGDWDNSVLEKRQMPLFSRRVSYNPYKASTFFYTDDSTPALSTDEVTMMVSNSRGLIFAEGK